MDYFCRYVSDCAMGSGNQSVFRPDDPERIYTCRTYYRLTFGGTQRYSLLYSNILDSTFSDGTLSHRNQLIDSWRICGCRIGLCRQAGMENPEDPDELHTVMFDGRTEKTAAPGEFFSTDPVLLCAEPDDFLCVEMDFCGRELPCHPESWLPGFLKTEKGWEYTTCIPFASMVGSDRKVSKRLNFMGDSITQGIGTQKNSYLHAAALTAKKLGTDTAVWDIALGFGRGNDAATDGAWLYKARQADAVIVCFGVNDLFRVQAGALLKDDLTAIVRTLKKNGQKVLIETVPPFDFEGNLRDTWEEVNRFILEELSGEADGVFDVVPVLGMKDDPAKAKYGGHPDERGNAAWAEALYPAVRKLLE